MIKEKGDQDWERRKRRLMNGERVDSRQCEGRPVIIHDRLEPWIFLQHHARIGSSQMNKEKGD